mgnify:CR=1 FL=1
MRKNFVFIFVDNLKLRPESSSISNVLSSTYPVKNQVPNFCDNFIVFSNKFDYLNDDLINQSEYLNIYINL